MKGRRKMKRYILSILVILFILGTLNAQDVSIGLETSYFIPSNQTFKDIYGGGIQYGGELSVDVLKRFSIWFGSSYFSKKGELSFTKEEIALRIIPVNLGINYRFTDKKVIPYIGIGMGVHFYRETAPRDTVRYARFGYSGQAGVLIELKEKFYLEFRIDYKYSTIAPDGTDINIGGIGTGLGLKYRL